MTGRINAILCSILIMVGLTSCVDADDDKTLYFIGDSIVARWDLAESFPTHRVVNCGRSGAGITYVESLAGQYVGRDVVVLFGTNDSYLMADGTRQVYARQYVDAIMALGASRVFLYSVLPREFVGDEPDINCDIATFNSEVRGLVDNMPDVVYMDVYDLFIHDGSIDYELYGDGLHLSAEGYEVLTSQLLKNL